MVSVEFGDVRGFKGTEREDTKVALDKVSGLKSILRVVLPAGAGLQSDLNQT